MFNVLNKLNSVLLTSGMYDVYKTGNTNQGLYTSAHERVFVTIKMIFRVVLNIGVYASVIAIIVSAVMLFMASDRGPKALQEGKEHIKRVLIVSVLIAGALELVVWAFKLGL